MRKYLDQEGVTTALRIAGWTWLALSVVLYMFLIDDTWRWRDTAGLVVIFRRSGADIALAATGLMVPGVLAVLAASVLRARRTRTKSVTTLKRVLPVLDQIPAGIRQANAMTSRQEYPATIDGALNCLSHGVVQVIR
jgi:hypothetical protein